MKQYVPMSGDYFLFMNEEESSDTIEQAVERAKVLLARRPSDHYLVLKVEKILKASDVEVSLEEVSLEKFGEQQVLNPFATMTDEDTQYEAVDEEAQ